jgi:hypothetical protein
MVICFASKGNVRSQERTFDNGCVPFQDKEGGLDVMNVVVRETGPPCAKRKQTQTELYEF